MKIAGSSVLVTGGCGFIGSHLVRELCARKAARVVVVDSMRCGDPANLGSLSNAVQIVPFTLGESATATLGEALAGIDCVVHLAAEKHQASAEQPRNVLRANVEGTYQLLEAARASGVRKAIFSSSLYAYGRMNRPPMREDETPRPSTVYGISKLAGEHLFAHFGSLGLPSTVLRYFFVYGPKQFAGQGYKSVIVKSCERLLEGQAPVVFGDGEQALDYTYVDDVVRATTLAIEGDADGEVINIGSGVGTSVNHLLKTLVGVANAATRIESAPADWTANSSRVADVSKARDLLGFAATTSLEEGLSRTYRWIAEAARTLA